nr:hypothetical protein [Tanacetum cinerariifolium]
IDYAYLMWEDFVYKVKHKNPKKSYEMYYPRFTKVIIHHFMSKDPSIPRRNKVNWHYARDDHISTIKLVSRHQNTTMDTTIEQQTAMDENLVPHAQRDILHICQRVHGQSFTEPPFKEEILAFIRFLGHSAAIRTLTDVNINKLYQPLRSFAAIINKYLTGKSSGYDSLRLSQAQILWGLYHKRNAIIHHFMSKDPSIPRKNKFGALLPIELTNAEIENSKAYKEYYAIATGEAAPKPKASVRRTRSSSDTSITPPIVAASKDERTGSKPGVPNVPTDESEEELSWDSTDDEDESNKETRDEESFDPIPQTLKTVKKKVMVKMILV